MQKLKEINLKKNKISNSVSKLAGNPTLLLTLETLNLSYNRIEDSDLDNVATVILQMKQLKQLDLYGNPLADNQTYKYRLCVNPTLVTFDGLDLKPGSLMR
jgi:Leucine-rich repeat (LRR) protein